jgi:hypothetical protein
LRALGSSVYDGKRSHVDDASDTDRGLKNVHGFCYAEQNWTNRNAVTRSHPEEIVCDIGCIDTGHDEKIGLSLEARIRKHVVENGLRQRRIATHLSINVKVGSLSLDKRKCVTDQLSI